VKRHLLILCFFLLASCFEPGGGGSIHNPPDSITRGIPTPLELKLSAVNAHGSMSRRMTSITCHYRLSGSPTFATLPMTPTNVDSRHLIARCTLPAFPQDARGTVEYYFEFLFDGTPNQYNTSQDPIRVPLK
jgi:hypothetical protein